MAVRFLIAEEPGKLGCWKSFGKSRVSILRKKKKAKEKRIQGIDTVLNVHMKGNKDKKKKKSRAASVHKGRLGVGKRLHFDEASKPSRFSDCEAGETPVRRRTSDLIVLPALWSSPKAPQ